MKWIRFIAISVMICLGNNRADACSDYYTPDMCNMFSVFNYNDLFAFNKSFYNSQFTFWKTYFGKSINEKTVKDGIFNTEGEILSSGTKLNALIKSLQLRKDNDGAHYLGLMRQMRSITSANAWDYPTKEQLAHNKSIWSYLQKDATSHIAKSSKLGNRYWLMAMRAAYYNNDKNGCLKLWNDYQSKYADGDIKMLAEGYLASYWYKDGQREKAREFYAKVGDLQSLRWCFKDDIQLKGIRKLYAETPNSVAFPYLIQDYVNALDNDLHPLFGWDNDAETDSIHRVVLAEINEFRQFAKQVIADGKIQHPALWKSASAYLAYLSGNNKGAIGELEDANQLKGTSRMKENIRILRFFVKSKDRDTSTSFENYALNELRWLVSKAKAEPDANNFNFYYKRNHYSDALQRIVLFNLTPNYLKAGKFTTAAALTGMENEFINIDFRENKRSGKYKKEWTEGYYYADYSDYYFSLLDSADVKDVVAYKELLVHPENGTTLEQYAISHCYKNMNYYNELIGTKYIRIEDYDNAITYLKPVSHQYIWAMNIAPYLHGNSSMPLWYSWKQSKTSKKTHYEEIYLDKNPKLLYCNSMLALKQRLTLATDNKERANLHYQLAEKYLQLTIDGNCWAYIYYSWSVASRDGNDYISNNIRHFKALAKSNLQESMKLNANVTNRVNCLFALASMSEESPWRTYEYSMKKQRDVAIYHPRSIQASYFDQIYRLRTAKEFALQGLSRCDNLKSYMRYYSMKSKRS
jgi:hypothetical protein